MLPYTQIAYGEETRLIAKEEKKITISQSVMVPNPRKLIFKVEGLCCATEVEHLQSVLSPLLCGREITLSFDLINAKLTLESNDAHFPSKDEILKAVASTGMKAALWNNHVQQIHVQKTFWQKHGQVIMNIISLVSLVIGFIFQAIRDGIGTAFGGDVVNEGEETERADYPPVATMAFYSGAIVAGSWFIVPKAVRAVRAIRPDTNLLVIAATGGAVGINQWFEAASSMYLFSVAGLLESWNMTRARKSIHALMELAPSTAQVVSENGTITEQLVEQISIGATITVRPGEKIPMDSILLLGSTAVNQAPITGESMPVQKKMGDPLFAGTINGDSVIQCRVSKAASDSTLASIIRKVEEAQSLQTKNKHAIEQWTEKFARYYVPSVMAASVMITIIPPLTISAPWYPWVYKGLEFLVIACPCSLVISTPVSIVAGLTAAARSGVIIKGGIYLETAAHIKAFAMNKTGILTMGEPLVQNIIPLNGYDRESLLKLASALEIHSDHPLARAIQRQASAEGIVAQAAEGFQTVKGKGAEGYIDGKLFWIGSHGFLHEKVGENESTAVHEKIQALKSVGHSIVAIGYGHQICGFISIADAVRTESRNTIQALKRAGIERVVMLTSDNEGAAKAIADSIGIDEYYAELLPENKVTQLESLVARYKRVAMVGDGINDAPAMAASSLGIAMGATGWEAAIETADIVLMSDDLGKLAWLINHSHRTLNIIKQNVIFSLAVKVAFVGLTFANKSTLWMAILSDMGASFMVVSNGLRLLNNKNKEERATVQRASPIINSGIELVPRKAPMLYEFTRTQTSTPRLLSDRYDTSLPAANQSTRVGCSDDCCSSNCHASSSLQPVLQPATVAPLLAQPDEEQGILETQTTAVTSSPSCKGKGHCSSDYGVSSSLFDRAASIQQEVVVSRFTAGQQEMSHQEDLTGQAITPSLLLVSQLNQSRRSTLQNAQIEQSKKAYCQFKACK